MDIPPPFEADERVLCHHENGLYEGIVKELKYDTDTTNWQCLIHYMGWNARHDDWVNASNVAKYTRKRALTDTNANTSNEQPRPKKRIARKEIVLPFTLKTILMEEYDCISARKWLHRLPAVVPIRKLLSHFRKKNEGSEEFVENMVQIFQEALPKCLLYEQERDQYKALNNDSTTKYVDIYGCEFLLRLAVQLPMHMPKKFQELLLLIQKNKVGLFPMTLSSNAHPIANYETRKLP